MKKTILTFVAIATVLMMVSVGFASEQNRNRNCNGQHPCGDPVPMPVPIPDDPITPELPPTPDNPTLDIPGDNLNSDKYFGGSSYKILLLGVRAGSEQARIDLGYNNFKMVEYKLYENNPIFIMGYKIGYQKTYRHVS